MENSKLDTNSKIIWIYIREKSNNDLVGVFFNPYFKEPIPFNSIADLIVKVESVTEEIRKMKESGIVTSITDLMNNYSKTVVDWNPKYFFVMEIMYKQQNSWQGRIQGSSIENFIYFKSVLELIMVLYDVLKIGNSDASNYLI